MADTIDEQQRIDVEWDAARTPSSSTYGARCPNCQHYISRHTTRVGEGIRICASCPCDRYAHYS